MESQVVYEPNKSDGAPSVKIMTPDKETNGQISNGLANGHVNGHLQVPNGQLQVPNGHANGHLPQDTHHLSPHHSPQKMVFPDHGIGMVPRSPRLNRRHHHDHSPPRDVFPEHGIGIVPRSPRLNRRHHHHDHHDHSPEKQVYPDHGIGVVPRSPQINRRHHHDHHEHHSPSHGLGLSPRLHRKKDYVPLEANEDEDELGEFRQEGRIPSNEKMMEEAVFEEEEEEEEAPKDR